MDYTKAFISDAIEGGWNCKRMFDFKSTESAISFLMPEILLDPLAWQAVGKTRGWVEMNYGFVLRNFDRNKIKSDAGAGEWHFKMHTFIDHLADGLSMEDALAKL